MTRTITFVGARGGQGTSTVAAALALHAAEDLPTALLTDDPTGMARLLGATGPFPHPTRPYTVWPGLTLAGLNGPRDTVTIIDAGPAIDASQTLTIDSRIYAVVRGPCYLALATLVPLPNFHPDGVVLLAEPGRSISAADTTAILGVPVVATVPVRPAIARMIDAGLLAGRPSEIPGLRDLSDALVHDVEPSATLPAMPSNRMSPRVARNGANHALPSGLAHEL